MAGPCGEKCSTCYYLEDAGVEDVFGWCVRYPPPSGSAMADVEDALDKAVMVFLENWCGEWKLHPNPCPA